jgi:hypothetical protein
MLVSSATGSINLFGNIFILDLCRGVLVRSGLVASNDIIVGSDNWKRSVQTHFKVLP